MTDVTTLLAGIKALEEAATPSPWKADTAVRGDCVVWGPNGRFLMNAQAEPHWLEYPGETRSVSFDVDARDAEFIAAARTDVPRLVAALEAVEDLARRLRDNRPGDPDSAFDRGYAVGRRAAGDLVSNIIAAALGEDK